MKFADLCLRGAAMMNQVHRCPTSLLLPLRDRHPRKHNLWPFVWRGFLLLTLVHASTAYPQAVAGLSRPQPAPDLPDAPSAASMSQSANGQLPASISGIILDANGNRLSGATVVLLSEDGQMLSTTVSADDGQFKFAELAPKPVTLRATAPGLAGYSTKITLAAGDAMNLQPIVLGIASTSTTVEVRVTQVEVAQEQIKAAEKQRVLGIVPNFYTSYIWDAAPLNTRQKFNLAFHAIGDPVQFIGSGVIAGAGQATNRYAGYGQGAEGYAKRYGAAYADSTMGKVIGSAALASLFHQDPRYFYKGSGTVRSRAIYAMSRAVITRGDRGQAEFNYSRILGSFAAGAVANAYHPASDRGVGLTVTNGFIDIAANAADNLIREFLSRRFTSNVPDYAKGKQ